MLQHVEFHDCKFDSVLLSSSDAGLFGGRHAFQDVQALDCRFTNCVLKDAELTKVSLIRCSGEDGGLILWKCTLKEVRIDGIFETLRILPPKAGGQGILSGTYALDVSTARCAEVEILGIPPELVRYDPQRGGILARRILDAERLETEASEYFGGILAKFRSYGGDRSVYVVPTEAPDAPLLIKELQELKARGLIS